MALAMEFKDGNTTIRIMDDYCSAPDQAERDAKIKKKICANALAAIRANPEKYYAVLDRKKKEEAEKDGGTDLSYNTAGEEQKDCHRKNKTSGRMQDPA